MRDWGAGGGISPQCHDAWTMHLATIGPPPSWEDAMKSDWLPEAVLALAFVVALVAQSARAFP